MASGILITHRDRPAVAGHWYPCDRKQAGEVLAAHLHYWGREPAGDIPPASLVVRFYADATKPDAAETLDAAKLLETL